MSGRALLNTYSLEREIVDIFFHCTGAGSDATAFTVTYENLGDPDVPFEVGETVTESVSNATGVVLSDDGTTLTLVSTSGTFAGSHGLTGGTSTATADSLVATAGTYFYNPTGLKGAGIASVTGAAFVAAAGAAAATGVYTITFDNKWAGLMGATGTILDATSPDDWEVTPTGQPTTVKTNTLVVRTFKGGSPTALTTDDMLYMEIVVSNAKGGTPGDLAGYSETTLA